MPRRLAAAAAVLACLTAAPVPASAADAPAVLDWRANACRPAETWRPEGVPQGAFSDTAGTTFASAADCLRHHGVAQGTGGGAYRPHELVTRAQMAAFLHRTGTLLGVPDWDPRPTAFTDVAALPEEQRAAVFALARAGTAHGTSPTTFSPQAPVTRGQMAAFLDRLHSWVGLELTTRRFGTASRFDDVGEVFRASADALANAGVAAGTGERRFSPERPVTRGQMAGFLARLLELNVRESTWAPPFPSSGDAFALRPHGTIGPVQTDGRAVHAPAEDQVRLVADGLPYAEDYRVEALDVRYVQRQPDGSTRYVPRDQRGYWPQAGLAWLEDGPAPVDGRVEVVVDGTGDGRVVPVLWRDVDRDGDIDPEEASAAGAVIRFLQPQAPPDRYDSTGSLDGRVRVDGVARRVDLGAVLQADPRTDRFLLDDREVTMPLWGTAAVGAAHVVVDFRTGPGGSSVFRATSPGSATQGG